MSSRSQGVPGAPGTELWDASRTDHNGPAFRDSIVNEALTPKPYVETPDYATGLKRMIDALGRRVASGDIEGLAQFTRLTDHLEHVMRKTITALRSEHGYSWAEIGRTLGTTKQGAQQRWGSP